MKKRRPRQTDPGTGEQMMVTHHTRRHLERVGTTTVLEAVATYPQIRVIDTEQENEGMAAHEPTPSKPPKPPAPAYFGDVATFNDTYRTLADTYLTWAKDAPARQAAADFEAAGRDAAYTFDRRLLTCRMEVTVTKADKNGLALAVSRQVTRSTRRGSIPPAEWTGQEIWRVRPKDDPKEPNP